MTRTFLLVLLIALPRVAIAQQGDQHQHHQHNPPGDSAWAVGSASEQLLEASFALVNGDNEIVTEQDFRGRYVLISFGFSRCKHVCPTILRDWAKTVEALPPDKAARLQALMISLDPERDSPQHMDQYSKLFNPDFQGLSGTTEQVARAAENFRVSYQKVPIGDNDYQINHTSMSYLVDPQGEVIDYYGFGTPSQNMADSIAGHIP
jgi:protein SCO1